MDPVLAVLLLAVFAVLAYRLGLRQRQPCGKCGAEPPGGRRLKSAKQMLWGGWTCPACGADLDWRGHPRD